MFMREWRCQVDSTGRHPLSLFRSVVPQTFWSWCMCLFVSSVDMAAVPDFAAGAMENWGLILYRETALLYKPGVSSEANKQRVAAVISHELAHMVGDATRARESCAFLPCGHPDFEPAVITQNDEFSAFSWLVFLFVNVRTQSRNSVLIDELVQCIFRNVSWCCCCPHHARIYYLKPCMCTRWEGGVGRRGQVTGKGRVRYTQHVRIAIALSQFELSVPSYAPLLTRVPAFPQWFGNLVTMKWWDDLWLNEGFASFVEYLGVNHVHPDWDMVSRQLLRF